MQKNSEEGVQGETCKIDSANAEPVPVRDEEDKYVVAEEKPCIFKGTFSDSDDECDTKFVHWLLFLYK